VYAIVLTAEFIVKAIFELGEARVLLAWYGDGSGLVACGVCFDLMLERVVVDVV
jgi:hypothetical protein